MSKEPRSPTSDFRLVGCDPDGRPGEPVDELPPIIAGARTASLDLYKRLAFVRAWVSYIAVVSGSAAGGGAFVGPPVAGRVEISYFTLPEHEGRGRATLTAQGLVAIARESQPRIKVSAKTAPEAGASTAILSKLGFKMVGTTTDHEIGEAWPWLLA